MAVPVCLLSSRYSIRPASAPDRDEIAALWHESWHDAHHDLSPAAILPERTLACFRQRIDGLMDKTLVAEAVSGEATATIGGFVTVMGNEVDQLFVARTDRGKGCAAALLAAAEARLRESGVSDAEIQCAAGNTRALAFYTKHGYRPLRTSDFPMWRRPGLPEICAPAHLLGKRLV